MFAPLFPVGTGAAARPQTVSLQAGGQLPLIVRVMSMGRIPVAVGAGAKLYGFSPGLDGTAVGWYNADHVLHGPVPP